MSDILTPFSSPFDAEQEMALNHFFAEMQRLNEQMRNDQADIDRLKIETRVDGGISASYL